jgi:hypothetical protein
LRQPGTAIIGGPAIVGPGRTPLHGAMDPRADQTAVPPPSAAGRAFRAAVLVAFLAALTASATAEAAAAPPVVRPLETAIVDPVSFTGPDAAVALDHAVAAGVGAIKIPLFWNEVAPLKRPAAFAAADPGSRAYNWSSLDAELRAVRAHGLEPIIYIAGAPSWAFERIDGAARPDPAEYRAFALAAVRRYSGQFEGLPRVRFWQAWNEPNKVPSRADKTGTAAWYRTLVNAFAAGAHSVPGNEVVAGGLAPFGISTSIAPLDFMRSVLCLDTHPACHDPVHFDIWSTDPYTAGGPTHAATHAGDVSVAELPEMKAVLDQAFHSGDVASPRAPAFWVTEFSWDSDPPDPGGVPTALEGRWVAQALYEMWSSGVSLVTWFTLRDEPFASSPYQSGLFFRGASLAADRRKPAFTAFRFPFVAFPDGKSISVWGRAPTGKSGAVRIEQHGPAGWALVARLEANRVGIFSAELTTRKRGPLRAVFAADGEDSLPFGLVSPPDRAYEPFGSPLPRTATQASSTSSAVSQYVELVPTAGGGAAVAAGGNSTSGGGPGSALAAVANAVTSGGSGAVVLGGVLLALAAALGIAAVVGGRSGRRS